ncbi:PKD domain-containing protein [uncultured Microbacterium sp.]|uniref:PKD domain-containing protein n=1 Tax=uncultured Microbacterium sp. TaxID=191216 RepID=UPI0028EB87D1|nr:PKD domain-containing protein [uncultured Microbacterium sp.]
MFGADVAVNGESVRLSTTVEQPANQPPTAVIAMTGNGLTYHFDASTSTDTDGVVASYLWDFGGGTYPTSAVVDHTYPAGQEYVPTLAVTDDGGRVGVASASRSVGAVGTSIGQSVILTNSTKITGPVHVKGDFNCNSNAGILGDIDVTGSAYLTNSCHIAGSLRVAGTVQMYSSPAIDGSIIAGGDVRFQSTARVGGSVVTAGSFVSVDGTTSADLNSNGRIVGQIVEGATLPAVVQPPVASTQADPALWPNSATRSWAQWMNDTARANAAPSWSAALTSNPGCTMAPWGSSVNGAVAQVSGNTIIDARSGCSSVTLQSMEVKIAGDVTIIASGFSSVNGLTVSSAGGRPHSFTVVTAGDRSCSSSSSGAVNLSAATTSDSNVTFGVDSSGRVTINGTSKLSGRVTAPCLSASGTVSIGG